jgi:uncharacterized protein
VKDLRVNVWKVLYDAQTGSSVVLLQTAEPDEHILPIWVGRTEALSIAAGAEKVSLGRPMTHDLLKTIVETAQLTVAWVRIHALKNGTFFSSIRLTTQKSDRIDIDARSSDAIALALRCDAPIFVTEQVLSEVLRDNIDLQSDIENLSEDFLENLPDELFGKYKM